MHTAELHGDMTQAARLESLEMFRTREASFLLATDVASRGLDISGVQVRYSYAGVLLHHCDCVYRCCLFMLRHF